MAPALTESSPTDSAVFTYDKPSKIVFPDGIKTSGQCEPNHDQLRPYSDFPKEITGQTVWDRDDYQHNEERWVHRFSEEEVQEMSDAADTFIASDTPLTGITKVHTPHRHRSYALI